MQAVCEVMGVHKVNTTAYHPQTDELVELFNRTLTDMLAKTVAQNERDWDTHLPYVLFAYRTSIQESTQESPFFLLYGRDPSLPTEKTLTVSTSHQQLYLDDYKTELTTGLAAAWQLAQANVRKAQQKQKKHHDRRAKGPEFRQGDRVFVYMPAAKRGKAYKFAKPFSGSYRIVELFNNGAAVQLIARPHTGTVRVALNRIRRCPKEIPDTPEPEGTAEPEATESQEEPSATVEEEATSTDRQWSSTPAQCESTMQRSTRPEVSGAWKNRPRPRHRSSKDTDPKGGEM